MQTAKVSRGGAPIGMSIEGSMDLLGSFLDRSGAFKRRYNFDIPSSDGFSVRIYDSLNIDGVDHIVEAGEIVGPGVRLTIIES
jgi:hypothetical protein